MKKRLYYATAAIVVFFGIGAILDFGLSKEDHLASYVSRIEHSLHEKETEVNDLLINNDFVERQLQAVDERTTSQHFANLANLQKLSSKEYNLCVYKANELLFWLNNRALLNEAQLEQLASLGKGGHLMKLQNGYFQVSSEELEDDSLLAIVIIPIKMEYTKESELLPNAFETDGFQIPKDVILSVEPTDFPIKNMSGKTLAWLDATGPAKNRSHLRLVFLIYVLGFISLGVLVNDFAVALVRRFQPWVGAAFMLAAVIGIRWITVELGFTKHFAEFETFSKIFTDEILEGVTSLGELLINIILLVWMMVFFNREFLVKEFDHPSKTIRFSLTTLNFFAINLGILMVSSIFKSIVLDSDIIFDFENVFNLTSQSVLAMVGVVLLLLALFLFSHRMMTAIHKIGMDKNWRLTGMALALVITVPVVFWGNLGIPVWHFMAAATLYLVIFEYFIEMPNMTLGWLVGWVMLYAGLSSMLLYKYNGDKDFKRRMVYAQNLTDYRDTHADTLLQELVPSFQNDDVNASWGKLQSIYKDGLIPREYARDIFDDILKEDKYIYNNYSFEVFAFDLASGSVALTEQADLMADLEIKFQKASALGHLAVRFMNAASREPGHLVRIPIRTEKPSLVFVKLKRSFARPSKVYTALLIKNEYKNLKNLDDYDYGIYQDRHWVEEWNKAYIKYLSDDLPVVGDSLIQKYTSKRSDLLYHAQDDIVIKIGKDTGGYIKPLSLFSYVFTLLAIAVLIFGGINYMTNALPGPLNFFRTTKPSLRNQFQFWVIGMILFSFLGIGFVSVWYFQQSSDDYHKGRLSRKVASALANVNYEISSRDREMQEIKNIRAQTREDLKVKFGLDNSRDIEILDGVNTSSLIGLISDVHRLDVNIYDLKGNLIASSEEDIFKQGIVAPKMGAYAFQELTKFGFEQSNQMESIGNLEYTAAYFPLKSLKGETTAYMGIPYYARQRELAKDVTDFMSTLLNVYVFLLLIAGGLAIVIANAITKALTELRENLGRLQLGGNQTLVYKRKDEIGELVFAYNQAVKKIEASSKLLEQSAQDHAWREMAKQIAHEIKNPLTPMKLSIQYLLHAYQSNPKDAEPLLKRVTKTLIEQIDSLAQIASEFSNFAKMPKPENSEFSINDLAASVHHLFANERTDMELSINLPEEDFEVFADRNHLTRVLNNLYKNAIQAVPDDRKGIVSLSLYREEDKAIICIKDNGAGIPPEIQKKVFIPNFSTKTSGTGLGLAICKSIVESFNGDIYFTTVEEVGTTFYVELPLRKINEPA